MLKSLFTLTCATVFLVTTSVEARISDEEKSYKYSVGAIVRTLQLQHTYFIKPVKAKSEDRNRDRDSMMYLCLLCTAVEEIIKLPGRAIMSLIPEPQQKQVLAPSFKIATAGLEKYIEGESSSIALADVISKNYGDLFDELDGVLKPIRNEFHSFNIKEFSAEFSNLETIKEVTTALSHKLESLKSNLVLRNRDAFKNLKEKLSDLILIFSTSYTLQGHDVAAYLEKELAVSFDEIITKVKQGELCIDYSRQKVQARIMYLTPKNTYDLTKDHIDGLIEKYSSTEPEGKLFNTTYAIVMTPGKFVGSVLSIANKVATVGVAVGAGTVGGALAIAGTGAYVGLGGSKAFANEVGGNSNPLKETGTLLDFLFTGN